MTTLATTLYVTGSRKLNHAVLVEQILGDRGYTELFSYVHERALCGRVRTGRVIDANTDGVTCNRCAAKLRALMCQ